LKLFSINILPETRRGGNVHGADVLEFLSYIVIASIGTAVIMIFLHRIIFGDDFVIIIPPRRARWRPRVNSFSIADAMMAGRQSANRAEHLATLGKAMDRSGN